MSTKLCFNTNRKCQVTSTDKSFVHKALILFDSGSQISYISPKTQDELQSLGKKEIIIKTFGNLIDKKTLDVVKFMVVRRDQISAMCVTALVSDICFRVDEQKIDIAKEKYPQLKNLTLADSNQGGRPLKIDVLIGSGSWRKGTSSCIV